MNKYVIITLFCFLFSLIMIVLNILLNSLPMTIMWGIISIIEALMMSIAILNNALGEKQ